MESHHTNPIAARFAAAAPSYDREATVQRRVARELVDLLAAVEEPASILEIGCGTGLLTELLAHRFRQSELHVLDFCEEMTKQARARLSCQFANNGRSIHWHVADARQWGAPSSFELVAGSSVLQWLTPIDQTMRHLAIRLRSGGQLVLGVMIRGTLAELRGARQMAAPGKTGRDALPSAESILTHLEASGLQLQESRELTLRNYHQGASDFLRAIRAQGITSGFHHTDALLNRSELKRLIRLYDQRYQAENGMVQATYQILLVRARRMPNSGGKG